MKVYLDYAATSPLAPEVLESMLPYLKGTFGNPDSLHSYGREAAYAVTRARDEIAAVLGVKPGEVYFTSGGTEADNWAVRCLGHGEALVSPVEHAAVLSAASYRAEGYRVCRAGQDGIVSADMVEEELTEKTGLVCLMSVNNETGCIQPLRAVSELCKTRGVLLFSDCVQAARSQNLRELCTLADGISLSAHKLGGPKGVGALVVKKGARLRPLVAGGEQERGLRGGTLNVAGIVGFAKALTLAAARREEYCAHTAKMRDTFEDMLFSALGEGVRRNGENRAPNISNLAFKKGGESFLSLLDLEGVACSGGAACSAHAALPSHVLLSMGRTESEAKQGVRFSFGLETTEEEVRFAAQKVISCLK